MKTGVLVDPAKEFCHELGKVSVVVADGFLHLLWPASVSAEVAAAAASGMSRSEFLGRYITDPTVSQVADYFGALARLNGVDFDPDTLHNGCWDLRICLTHNTVSVVKPTDGCPLCDPTSTGIGPAEDSPAAESDGPATTAPAAGHPDPLHEAAAAYERMSRRLNNLHLRPDATSS